MTTPFPGHSAPAAGFEVPLEMLAACHLRVDSQCATLRRLVAHLASHGADTQASQAATAVMRYFDTSARDHHADEEVDLFPALLACTAGDDPAGLHALIAGLIADHRVLEQRWAGLRQALQAVRKGDASALSAGDVDDFVGLYEQHIAREEAEVLPRAQRLLGTGELDRIGLAMRERRGVGPGKAAA
ncbi:MAG: hemerythrin domain-containing protein [Rhizobacter sp.]|nr:hemerythrin domain-containing protein [Rhizobacter sp.]